MPQRSTSVRIPRPCPASWAAMMPTPAGRHCATCQKVVVDFTQQTDAEILAYLAGAAGPTCGRFRAEQLARPLRPAVPGGAAPRWRTCLAALVAAGGALGAGRAAAQTTGSGYFSAGPTPTPAAQPATPAAAPLPPTSSPAATPSTPAAAGAAVAEVRGVVTDSITGDPLPGVTVLIRGTTNGISTDMTGAFVLPLEAKAKTVQLVFSSVGYVSQEKTVATHGNPPLTVALAADTRMLGEVIMAGGYETVQPRPWHPRRLYHWTKYQLSRPFRH